MKKLVLKNVVLLAIVTLSMYVNFPVGVSADDTQSQNGIATRVLVLDANERIYSVAFSPDKKLLAGGGNGKVFLWNDKGEVVHELAGPAAEEIPNDPLENTPDQTRPMISVVFSPDNNKVAAAFASQVFIWDLKADKPLELIGHAARINTVAFSPDGTKLVTGSADKKVKVWDTKSGQTLKTLSGHNYAISSATYSKDGKVIVTLGTQGKGKSSGEIVRWNAESGNADLTVFIDDCYAPGAVLTDGGQAILGDAGRPYRTKIWDASTGRLVRVTEESPAFVFHRLAASGDLRLMAGGAYQAGDDTTGLDLSLWELRSGRFVDNIRLPVKRLNSLAFTRDGTALAFGTDESVEVWSVNVR